MKKIVIIIILFSSLFTFAFDPSPKNEINCSADIFPPGPLHIPLSGVQPFQFSLASNENEMRWLKQIEKVEINEKDKPFLSTYWFASETMYPSQKQNIKLRTPIVNGEVEFKLSRFPQAANRVAGLGLSYNVGRGFYGSYLLDKNTDGPVYKIHAPIHFDEGDGILSIDCVVRD